MPDEFTISPDPPPQPGMDFARLRAEGMAHLQALSGAAWTDHNTHDPGITILEQFCYALTDLGYRIDYDLKDLLASGGHGEDAADNCLFSPGEVLTGNAVTITDWRKVVIDVDGVNNAWIEPVETPDPVPYYDPADDVLYLQSASHRAPVAMRGLYRVTVQADESVSTLDFPRLREAVSQRLHACRNLGEDFEPPVILDAQKIFVTASVEIGQVNDPDKLLAEVYRALADYISPGIRFYTLAEMLARGKRLDEIMDGPILDHGFIDTEELERCQRKSALRTSDMIQRIMKIEGVRAVHQITISNAADGKGEAWYLNLDPLKSPVLAPESKITLVRGKANATTNPARVEQLSNDRIDASRSKPLSDSERDVPLPIGRDRQIERYHSIQHQFPQVYGVGEFGLPASASPTRQAQARQLKAYLMFFDQLLANAFSQLAHARDLFSVQSQSGAPHSYFTQPLDGVPRVEEVLVSGGLPTHAAQVQQIAETLDTTVARRNRFLNHLLARFGEDFADYSAIEGVDAAGGAEVLEDKCAFLRHYREIGAGRSRAFNYSLPSWESENVSGMERRISGKLGLVSCRRRSLQNLDENDRGGFHLVEHILLRPRAADQLQGDGATVNQWQAYATLAKPLRDDPFSAQLTFVFPKWIERFQDETQGGIRGFVARTVREETPAHLLIRLCWLSKDDMTSFETAFQQALDGLRTAAAALSS